MGFDVCCNCLNRRRVQGSSACLLASFESRHSRPQLVQTCGSVPSSRSSSSIAVVSSSDPEDTPNVSKCVHMSLYFGMLQVELNSTSPPKYPRLQNGATGSSQAQVLRAMTAETASLEAMTLLKGSDHQQVFYEFKQETTPRLQVLQFLPNNQELFRLPNSNTSWRTTRKRAFSAPFQDHQLVEKLALPREKFELNDLNVN